MVHPLPPVNLPVVSQLRRPPAEQPCRLPSPLSPLLCSRALPSGTENLIYHKVVALRMLLLCWLVVCVLTCIGPILQWTGIKMALGIAMLFGYIPFFLLATFVFVHLYFHTRRRNTRVIEAGADTEGWSDFLCCGCHRVVVVAGIMFTLGPLLWVWGEAYMMLLTIFAEPINQIIILLAFFLVCLSLHDLCFVSRSVLSSEASVESNLPSCVAGTEVVWAKGVCGLWGHRCRNEDWGGR